MAEKVIKTPAVIEVGIDNNCIYEKFSNGMYHATYLGTVSYEAGTAWFSGSYYHKTTAITAPSFSTIVSRVYGGLSTPNLAMYSGCQIKSKNEIYLYFVNATPGVESGRQVAVEIYGSWA